VTLRDDLIPVVDEARGLINDLGFRRHAVTVRTTTWSGAKPGLGSKSVVELVLSPPPKVRGISSRRLALAPGRFKDGDRVVDRISATYTADQLGGALAANQERVWLIDADEYTLIGEPTEKNLAWEVTLRRKARG